LMFCSNLSELLIKGNDSTRANFANPVPVKMRKACPGPGPGGTGPLLSKGNLPFGPLGDRSLFDFGPWRIPGIQPQNWNEGIRFHTLIDDFEVAAFDYLDNTNQGVASAAIWRPYTNLWSYDFPEENLVGLTADRPVPLTTDLQELLPLVARAEV